MKVLIMPANITCEVAEEKSLLEVLRQSGVFVESPCGGNHTCGKCKVLVTKGNDHKLSEEEKRLLTEEEEQRGMRLACAMLVEEDLTVLVPRQKKDEMAQETCETEAVNKDSKYGIAIDVGTTTVEFGIVHLESKRTVAKQKFFNPQIAYGADVIARITYCVSTSDGERILRECLISKLNRMISSCLQQLNIEREQIKRAAFVGNTTMSYLLSGTGLKSLAKAPFTLQYEGDVIYPAKQFGLSIAEDGEVYVALNIAGHVGSDAYACLLATRLHEKEGNHLLVDVGTNGEILLSSNNKVYACSTAAGPAFEGAGLSCGMRASTGAITKAKVCHGRIDTEVVGQLEAEGISGSGIIDLLACMLELGVMDDTGYIKEEAMENSRYPITNKVGITREDVRQIQLAKGAIAAGIQCLMEEANVSCEALDGIYLAGAFGSNIDTNNAKKIGLLPNIDIRKVHNLGNAAMDGARRMLLNWERKEDCHIDTNEIVHVELAQVKKFRECFIENINFRSLLF